LDRMKCPHMQMLLWFSGGLKVLDSEPMSGSFEQMFKATDKDGNVLWWTYSLRGELGDDTSICKLKEYFRSMFTAYALGVDIIVSL